MRLFKKEINGGCAWARMHAFGWGEGGATKPRTHCERRRLTVAIVGKETLHHCSHRRLCSAQIRRVRLTHSGGEAQRPATVRLRGGLEPDLHQGVFRGH